jgi:hypothetical protein
MGVWQGIISLSRKIQNPNIDLAEADETNGKLDVRCEI